jgi:uncharacterized membrane protein
VASANRRSTDTESRPADQVNRNIAAIAQLEKAMHEQRSAGDRLSSRIAGFVGTVKFVLLHLVWVWAWIAVNRQGSSIRFDPFPYDILILTLALEAILLSTFVLINQNHMARMTDRRTHLTLQISLLAESEMTKVLDTLRTISLHLGLPDAADDEKFRDLSRETHVEQVVEALDEQLPDSPGASTATSSS